MTRHWTGIEAGDCLLQDEDDYGAHVENMGEGWFICVWRIEHGSYRTLFNSSEYCWWPKDGEKARGFAEMMIDADRWRREHR